MDRSELVISEYASIARSYRDALIKHLESQVTSFPLEKSTFKSASEYLEFKKRSLNELITILTKFSKYLEKYNKFKTLNKKIIRGAIDNNLVQGKFYDYAIGYYNFLKVEPEIFGLIDSHFKVFCNLSKQLEEINGSIRIKKNL